MKNHIYLLIEEYTDDFKNVNACENDYKIISAHYNSREAGTKLLYELRFQCDNDEEWNYEVKNIDDTTNCGYVFFNGELQYKIILKEIEIN